MDSGHPGASEDLADSGDPWDPLEMLKDPLGAHWDPFETPGNPVLPFPAMQTLSTETV